MYLEGHLEQSAMTEIATLITAIASLATALVALWNIRELKLSRSVASSPSIIPKGDSFGVLCGGENPQFIGSTERPTIYAINFGNGPAIEPKVQWQIPNDELVGLLQSYDPHDEYQVGIGKSPFAEDPVINLYWNHFIERQIKDRLESILPHPVGESTKIQLPSYYVEAFHLYIKLAVHNRPEKKMAFDLASFPKASFKLYYQDLAGDKHTKTFDVSLRYDHNATQSMKKENAYAASLQVVSNAT